jgi:hypothetical protein
MVSPWGGTGPVSEPGSPTGETVVPSPDILTLLIFYTGNYSLTLEIIYREIVIFTTL